MKIVNNTPSLTHGPARLPLVNPSSLAHTFYYISNMAVIRCKPICHVQQKVLKILNGIVVCGLTTVISQSNPRPFGDAIKPPSSLVNAHNQTYQKPIELIFFCRRRMTLSLGGNRCRHPPPPSTIHRHLSPIRTNLWPVIMTVTTKLCCVCKRVRQGDGLIPEPIHNISHHCRYVFGRWVNQRINDAKRAVCFRHSHQ